MKYSTTVIFGKEQVAKLFARVPFSEGEEAINVKKYSFATKAELDAFVHGLNEAVGWLECFVAEVKGG
jgi:hypothetical protein